MQRRRVILAIGSVGAGGLAGCVGGRRDPGGESPADATPPELATSFSVTSAGCGSEANEAAITYDDGGVVIEGTTWGNDACYTARLGSATLEEDTLTLRIVTERADDDAVCAQCITEIEYRATVEVPRRPARVLVRHDGEVVAEATPG